ncbi:LysR family transcriptional regulator [Microbacterium sp.]|uniref:LysR family transcriptional regulator n=1 Tax=Microbacterium sp. TaxID=51671 RepID=UPI0039E37D6B
MAITLAQLRAFVAVADHEGFAAAADELGVTQSAISHAVATLEGELGLSLLHRRPALCLTTLGDDVLGHARAALASADALVLTARQRSDDRGGTVRLGVTSTVCFGLLPQLLTRWRDAAPQITVRVFEGDDPELLSWLEDGTVDAAILINPERPHADAVAVGDDRYCAVVRDDHPLANSEHIAVEELLEDAILVSGGGCGPDIIALLRSRRPEFTPAQRVYDNAALLNLVAAGLGVTVFPSIGVGMLASGTRMICLEPSITRTMIFSGPTRRPWNPLVTRLRDALTPTEIHSEARAG